MEQHILRVRTDLFIAMTVGQRVKQFAKARYGTQAALAKRVGVSDGQLSDYVRDRFPPGAEFLQKLAGAGANIHWILTGEGDMDAPTVGTGTRLENDLHGKTLYTVEQFIEMMREKLTQPGESAGNEPDPAGVER